MNRAEYINGLRAIADFFEQHPEIRDLPHPYLFANLYSGDPIPTLRAVAKAAGSAKKNYTDGEFQIELHFGAFMVRYDAPRDKVCERIKVAEKVIPAHVLPAREETLIPEKVEEVFEWRCPESLLSGGAA